MQPRILFVDDEPRILTAQHRMLRSLRSEWEMVFAEGGAEALRCCAAQSFDVVVSDARMPGMEGSELLGEVRRLYPDTVRMILSGQCSRDSVLQCVEVAHQFLSKPCDPATLKAAVEKVFQMRAHFRDADARKAVACVQRLPSQAAAYAELVERVESAAASMEHVAQIIARDVALCANCVHLVSSGFFGTPQRVSDGAHAAKLLGLETIKALLDSATAFVPADRAAYAEDELQRLNEHSAAVAAAARQIAESVSDDRALIGDAYLSGMLHEVGALALLGGPGRTPLEARGPEGPAADAGPPGPDAGGYLAALWGLPDPMVQALGYHRTPHACRDQSFAALTAVHVAHALLEPSPGAAFGAADALDMDYLRRAGCADRLDGWRAICAACRPEGVLQ